MQQKSTGILIRSWKRDLTPRGTTRSPIFLFSPEGLSITWRTEWLLKFVRGGSIFTCNHKAAKPDNYTVKPFYSKSRWSLGKARGEARTRGPGRTAQQRRRQQQCTTWKVHDLPDALKPHNASSPDFTPFLFIISSLLVSPHHCSSIHHAGADFFYYSTRK